MTAQQKEKQSFPLDSTHGKWRGVWEQYKGGILPFRMFLNEMGCIGKNESPFNTVSRY